MKYITHSYTSAGMDRAMKILDARLAQQRADRLAARVLILLCFTLAVISAFWIA